MDDDQAMSARQVARLLGVSIDTVKRAIPPEELPFFRLGGPRAHRRYLRSDVEAYLASRQGTGK